MGLSRPDIAATPRVFVACVDYKSGTGRHNPPSRRYRSWRLGKEYAHQRVHRHNLRSPAASSAPTSACPSPPRANGRTMLTLVGQPAANSAVSRTVHTAMMIRPIFGLHWDTPLPRSVHPSPPSTLIERHCAAVGSRQKASPFPGLRRPSPACRSTSEHCKAPSSRIVLTKRRNAGYLHDGSEPIQPVSRCHHSPLRGGASLYLRDQ